MYKQKMKPKLKKIIGYGVGVLIAVSICGAVAFYANFKINEIKLEYSTTLLEREKEIAEINSTVQNLEAEIETYKSELEKTKNEYSKLKEGKEELQETVENTEDNQAELEKHYKIMDNLAEVYNLIGQGDVDSAVGKINSINPAGFSDGEYAFYDMLKKILQN